MHGHRVVVPLLVFGAVVALSVTVTASPKRIAAGSAQVRSCTTLAHLSVNPTYRAEINAYAVGSVSIDSGKGCAGKQFQLALFDGSVLLAQATGQLDTAGSAVAEIGRTVAASKVTNIGLTLTDAPASRSVSDV